MCALALLPPTLERGSAGGTYGTKDGTLKEWWAAVLAALECRPDAPYTSLMSARGGVGVGVGVKRREEEGKVRIKLKPGKRGEGGRGEERQGEKRQAGKGTDKP